MSSTKTHAALLVVAVQDLFDAETAWRERLQSIADHVTDGELAGFVRRQAADSREQADRLADVARLLDAPKKEADNIWLRAVLDDAARDVRTIEKGSLLDIALVGALRKGKQAERVSYETAICLANLLDETKSAELLVASRDEEAKADALLAGLLERLCGASVPVQDAALTS